ncbi:MAG: YqeG family HAD IIIA-type phosphatase [Oscillospiraceae bacterium]
MRAYIPDFIFKKTVNITPEFLKEQGIKNLLLDVDNTLATHGNPVPAEGIIDWLSLMQHSGIKLMVTSNNFKKRVEPFARELGLDFVSFSAKPTPFGFWRGMKKLGAKKSDTAVVGDQIFTDILGAHMIGLRAIMVMVILEEDGWSFKLKRKFEKKYIDIYKKTKGEIL